MIGAIAGDIIGSVHEFVATKTVDFPLFVEHSTFTDDSVLTLAVAECLLDGTPYVEALHRYARAYPGRGYGGYFQYWVEQGLREPYNSWGNGSAMRVSAVGFAARDLDAALAEAKRSAEVTHNHPEGIRGAQATAATIFLGRTGKSKEEIRAAIEARFGYDLKRTVEEIRPGYEFDVSCQGSVPEAIIAFLDSEDFESAIRLAISLGGDADTLACITGGIAEAFYGGVPPDIAKTALGKLDAPLRSIVDRFTERFGPGAD